MCDALLKSGPRKGLPCNNTIKTPANGKCGRHAPAPAPPKEKQEQNDSEETVSSSSDEEERVVPNKTNSGTSIHRFVETVQLENAIYVCNVYGSSKDKGGWKEFYTKHAKVAFPNTCRAKDCEKKATATGHMYLRDDDNKKHNYLIPICAHHNSSRYDTTHFLLKKNVTAVKIRENPKIK